MLLFEQLLLAFFQALRQLASSEHELFCLKYEDLSQDGNSDGAVLVLWRDLTIDDIRPGCVIAPICEENLSNGILGLLVRENYFLNTLQFWAFFLLLLRFLLYLLIHLELSSLQTIATLRRLLRCFLVLRPLICLLEPLSASFEEMRAFGTLSLIISILLLLRQ